jgi:hypothetical protein
VIPTGSGTCERGVRGTPTGFVNGERIENTAQALTSAVTGD